MRFGWVGPALLVMVGCVSHPESLAALPTATIPEGSERVGSEQERLSAALAPSGDVDAQARANTDFAFDLYREIRDENDNMIFSPHSISTAFAMTYAGAAGDTRAEMGAVFGFTLEEPALHHAFNALDQTLARRHRPEDGVELVVSNQAWAQRGHTFLPDYLDVLAADYGASVYVTDIAADPEGARSDINEWVSTQTRARIEELLPMGAIDPLTVHVLVNAVYFNGQWRTAFDASETDVGAFRLADGSEVDVPFMAQTAELGYASGAGWSAVELPYARDELTMVAILPDDLDAFESSMDAGTIEEVVTALAPQAVTVELPRFSFGSHVSLRAPLERLGLSTAFTSGLADLSRMDGGHTLYVQDALHGAFIEVTESGTEAAAATAVIVGTRGAGGPPRVRFDRPFLFAIRDRETGALVFLGRVVDPGV